VCVCDVLTGSAVTGSVQGFLEGNKYKFHRMPSVDAFNEVLVYVYCSNYLFFCSLMNAIDFIDYFIFLNLYFHQPAFRL